MRCFGPGRNVRPVCWLGSFDMHLNPVLKPVLTPVRDLGEFIRDQRIAAQISIRGLAARAGVSNPYLSQVERGLRRPSAEILAHIAHGLSISVESLLAQAGILETGEASEVVAAVRGDTILTERQKMALIDIYTAFRKQAETAASVQPPEPAASEAQLPMAALAPIRPSDRATNASSANGVTATT